MGFLGRGQRDCPIYKLILMNTETHNFNRLSLGIMEKDQCSPKKAMEKLQSLSLYLLCGDEIASSLPLQAALLTAVNSGKRAFLGGVFVVLPDSVPLLLPWPGKNRVTEILEELGAIVCEDVPKGQLTLTFGAPGLIDDNRIRVICNDWQGGIWTNESSPPLACKGSIPVGGIFAGALAVSLAFFKNSGIYPAAGDQSTGISLWRPDLNWLEKEAGGPIVSYLPAKYWILGLGHLGQAYLWTIGMLPYEYPDQVKLLLQDDDKIEIANLSAGLLSELSDAGQYKTRICSRWLERRGYEAMITERRFDKETRRKNEEPFIALCGFDSAKSRLALETAGFDLIVEAGLGSKLTSFDKISFHTFPDAAQTPEIIWGGESSADQDINAIIYDQLKDLSDETCGILPITIAGKAISASFVGACTGSLVISELLRGLQGGVRYDKISVQLRDLLEIRAIPNKENCYTTELARNGFLAAKT